MQSTPRDAYATRPCHAPNKRQPPPYQRAHKYDKCLRQKSRHCSFRCRWQRQFFYLRYSRMPRCSCRFRFIDATLLANAFGKVHSLCTTAHRPLPTTHRTAPTSLMLLLSCATLFILFDVCSHHVLHLFCFILFILACNFAHKFKCGPARNGAVAGRGVFLFYLFWLHFSHFRFFLYPLSKNVWRRVCVEALCKCSADIEMVHYWN